MNTDASDLSDAALGVPEVGVDLDVDVQSQANSNEELGDEEVGVEAKPDLGGLPFKNIPDFVSGHKSLQESYRSAKTELYQLQEQMRQIAPLLQKLQSGQGVAPQVEEAVDIPKFLETFITTGPKAIQGLADKAIEAKFKEFQERSLGPLQLELARMKGEKEIDKFISDNPELDDSDEEALMDIVRGTPWISKMQGTVGEKLDAALSVLTRKEPSRWSTRAEAKPRQSAASAVASMKQSASTIGVKAGTRQRALKDEFDEVLDINSSERNAWR